MRPIRVYVDTSVFGGTQDEAFAEASERFFDLVRNEEFVVLLSTETLRELAESPDPVQSVWQNLPPQAVEILTIDAETEHLAREYVQAGVVGPAWRADALHVAAATVAGADLVLSWNFKHIVNFNRIRGFNGINVRHGYRALTILCPLEVRGNEQEDV